MKCPNCGVDDNEVQDTRPKQWLNWRLRECQNCKIQFLTREMVDPEWLRGWLRKKQGHHPSAVACPNTASRTSGT